MCAQTGEVSCPQQKSMKLLSGKYNIIIVGEYTTKLVSNVSFLPQAGSRCCKGWSINAGIPLS